MILQALIVGGSFVLMGVAALASPRSFAEFIGTKAETSEYRNEVRAVYGGFGICLGALIMFADPLFPGVRDGIFVAGSVSLFGMASGRLFSFVVERTGPWPVAFSVIEMSGAALLYSAVGR